MPNITEEPEEEFLPPFLSRRPENIPSTSDPEDLHLTFKFTTRNSELTSPSSQIFTLRKGKPICTMASQSDKADGGRSRQNKH